MDDITSRLRCGLHRPEAIILGGVTHDQRCLIAADEIDKLRDTILRLKFSLDGQDPTEHASLSLARQKFVAVMEASE